MHIHAHHEYAAEPRLVHDMLISEQFLRRVVAKFDATSSAVSVQDGRSSVELEMEAPEQVRKIIGASLRVSQNTEWLPLAGDGTSSGTVSATVAGMPAQLLGVAKLAPGGKGTTVDYDGTFEIKLPLIGNKLASVAYPYVMKVLNVQQPVGDAFLAENA